MRIDWHILPETDELSTRNGSAVLTVARNLQTAAHSIGQQSLLVGSANSNNNLPGILEIVRPKSRIAKRTYGRVADTAAKYILGKSLLIPRIAPRLGNPTHIYCHNQPWLIPNLRRAYPEARIYLYVHNKILRGARASTIRSVITAYDHVICVSEFIRRDLGARARMPWHKLDAVTSTHMHGVRTAPHETSVDRHRHPRYDVAYVGRIIPEKGVHVLAEALEHIARDRPISAVIVGGRSFLPAQESTYERELRTALANSGVDVTFTGPVPPSHVPSFLDSSRVHVVPSTWDEPCGLVVLEGLTSRACVIATAVGGIPEIAKLTTLQLVPREDALALTQAITNYLDNPEQTAFDSKDQQEWAITQNWSNVYRGIMAIDEHE